MEEDEDEQDTSIRGRLLMLVNKIKGQSHKAEEPTEKEQAAPCEEMNCFINHVCDPQHTDPQFDFKLKCKW